jgi:two-component system nitrogen regulation response regulator NtrX
MSDPAAGAPAPSPRPTILVVDDERNIRRALDLVLGGEGYEVLEAPSAERALSILERRHVDLAILDINLPGMSGLDLLGRLRQEDATRELPAIVISGHGGLDDAAHAVALGAVDFFDKPLHRERVLVSVRNALRASHLTREVAELSAEVLGRYEMIGQTPAMKQLFAEIERLAPTAATVLVTGETGTGKELMCRALHRLSDRSRGPFVRVNCAAIPQHLVDSELFGYEKGAFTGARGRRRGLFEAAHGGTLFLDEVGEMEPGAQAKLLRALDAHEIVRVGGEHPVAVDVRVLAATNQDLKARVKAGRFREDLFYRLEVLVLESPPLSARMADVPLLADTFLAAFCKENGLRPKRMAPEVHAELSRRRFPGNVRELKNTVERAAILSGEVVRVTDLPEDRRPASPGIEIEIEAEADDRSGEDTDPGSGDRTTPLTREIPAPPAQPVQEGPRAPTLRQVREDAERAYIALVLERVGFHAALAAGVLGVDQNTLRKRMKRYGLTREEKD